MGIDLSKAFDCINRKKLLQVIEPHIDNSLYRLITYLLSDTNFAIKVSGIKGQYTRSTIGTPQGDALSPILFIIYLVDAVINEYWHKCGQLDYADFLYCMYADDTDFISTVYTQKTLLQSYYYQKYSNDGTYK